MKLSDTPKIALFLLFVLSGFSSHTASYASINSIHVVTTICCAGSADFGVYDPANKLLFVLNNNEGAYCDCLGSVTIINTTSSSVIKTVNLHAENPMGIIYDPSNEEVYAGGYVFDGTRIVSKTLGTGYGTFKGYNPFSKLLYDGDGDVVNTTTNTIVSHLNFSNMEVMNFAYDPADHEVYATAYANTYNSTSGKVTYTAEVLVLKGTKEMSVLSFGENASFSGLDGNQAGFLAYNPYNKYIYVPVNAYSFDSCCPQSPANYVALIDGNRIVTRILVPNSEQLFGIKYDPNNEEIYLSDIDSENIYAISSSSDKVVVTIPTGCPIYCGDQPIFFAYDPANRDIYATTYNSTIVISPSNKIVTSINETSAAPNYLVFDKSNSYVYSLSENVTVISS